MCGTDQHFDQSIQILDLGSRGYIGPAEIKFFSKPTEGSTVSVVACTDHEVIVNLRDSGDGILLHVAVRPYKDIFGYNHFLNNEWGPHQTLKENPIKKGIPFSLIIHHEKDGYRIFVNETEIAYYKHQSESIGARLEISSCQLFKVTYLTTIQICTTDTNDSESFLLLKLPNQGEQKLIDCSNIESKSCSVPSS